MKVHSTRGADVFNNVLPMQNLGFIAMGRKVYIDLGANNGLTVEGFRKSNQDFVVFAFEPNPRLAERLRAQFAGPDSGVHIMEYAAWIVDGQLDFYLGDVSDQSSTLIPGKQASPEWTVDYSKPTRVKSIDFSRWFGENTSRDDLIVIKMDIEGSEYKLLRRMLDTSLIDRVSEIRVEWHWDRYPGEISRDDHDRIRNSVKQATRLIDWH